MSLTEFDASKYLDDPEMITEYLNAALEEGDMGYFMQAIGNVAKAKGMTSIAEETGLGRASLYKTVSGEVTPKIDTVQHILNAMGKDFQVTELTG